MKTLELDIVFLSYDEPNADQHYADLCNKVPWAKRVHGVKGSDAAHKAAAKLSETDWVITVDADNIVDNRFFNLGFDPDNKDIQVDSDRAQVDFCWEAGYKQFAECYSETVITGSPFQAWRAGFREGVKMTLLDGVRIPADEIQERVWWHNLHRLKIWSTVGAHEENGLYAVYGARLGQWMTNCTDWNYVDVRDFDILKAMYFQYGKPYEDDKGIGLEDAIRSLGYHIKRGMGFDYPYLAAKQSKYTLDLYEETIKLTNTYLR